MTVSRTTPLSHYQYGIWLGQQSHPEDKGYNTAYPVRIRSEVDSATLQCALQQIMERHPILRTTYPLQDGQPIQAVQVDQVVTFNVLERDWTQEQLREWAEEINQKPYDLAEGPLFQVYLVSTAPNDHLLLMLAHHIVLDMGSWWNLLEELDSLYPALLKGTSVTLPTITKDYQDFTDWHNSLLARKETQLARYWKTQLAGEIPILELPTDRPRPSVKSYTGGTETLSLSASLSKKLRQLAAEQQTTLYTTLLAAYQLLLARLARQDDVIVGTPVATRAQRDFDYTAGLFANFVPIRANLSGNRSFKEFLHEVKKTVFGALVNQAYPFYKLVESLSSTQKNMPLPIFQTVFQLEQATHNGLAELLSGVTAHKGTWAGMEVETFPLRQQEGRFDLHWVMYDNDPEITGTLFYDHDLFMAGTIQKIISYFHTLLEQIVADPAQSITTISIVPEAEQHQLRAWNDTSKSYQEDLTLIDLFETQVEQTPENIAVSFEGQTLSYHQLNIRANQLAHQLQSLTDPDGQALIQPDTLVGICVERSLDMIIGLLGILKAGGAYVPLDPSYPAERLQIMLEDSQVPIVLTQRHLQPRLEKHTGIHLNLDDKDLDSTQLIDNPATSTTPNQLAYVLYTSGSTGRPKGVMIEHRSAQALISWALNNTEPSYFQGTLASTSINFDLSVYEIFVTLSSGGKLILAENALQLATLFDRDSVTLINTVPSAITELVRIDAIPTTVQCINLAGEPLKQTLVQTLYQQTTLQAIYNLYGPSEDTTYTTYALMQRGRQEAPTIGKPITNTQVYILDAQQQPLPIGIPGELCIAGAGLARGYLNRPELTAEKFIQIALFGNIEWVYKTGDLARWLPDGNLEYLGRIDNQIKLRGFRIELGEIEQVLSQYATVSEAVVVLHERDENKALAAYVTPASENDKTDNVEALDALTIVVAGLRKWLKTRLPDYMLPSYITILDNLPLTPNGKIDRKALPEPDITDETVPIRLQTETEQLLATLWTAVLKREVVSAQAHFFELGGHSLLATQLSARIREAFTIELPLATLFDYPILSELAHWLDQQQRGATLPPIQPQAADEPLVLSYAQQRLWFLAQLEGQSSTYNMPAAMRLQGKLNLEALRVTFAELIKRQHSLRLSFPVIAGKAIAELLPVYDPMSIIDLSTLDTAAQQDQVKILGQTYRNTPFDLGTGPLFRLRLLVLSPDEHILLLNFHHIISDGWSMNVLIREWIALYTAFSQGQTPERQPLPINYPDYAAWQHKWLQGEVLKKQQDYWTAQLAGAPQLIELPTDQSRPGQQSYQGAYYQHSLSAKLTTELNQLSQAHNSTLFMVLLSSFNVLLHRYTGQDDILIGTPIAGRTQRETENLIGLFVNTLVLRTQIGTACPFDELLRQTRQTTLQAYAHQDLPFEQLVEALQPERSLSHSPLFQVMFVLQNNEITKLKLPNLAISPVEQTSTIAKFDLTLNITETAGQLELYWEYATDLFEPERIARMAAHFTTLLEHIVQNPRAEIQTLPLLTTAETTQLHAWNDTVTEYQEDLTLVDLFETQVKQTRDNIAVSFEGQTLSYQQLNTRANQLAHHLRSLTDTDNQALIQPDTLVGICVERSLEMIIGLLGILKAGAAYVPLDPDYPQDRLQYMLEDSQVRVLLTQRYLQTPLNTHSGIILCLDEADYFSTESTQNSLRRAGPDNLAYVIYTSGSTGKPKGAINAHRGIYNRIVWMQDHFGLTTEDRVLQKTPFSFDVSVWEFFWPLITGARLVIAKPQGHQDPHYLSQLIDEQRISTLHFVPPMLQAYLEAIPTADTSLQRIICSGEALPYTLQQRCLQTLPKVQLHNLYGPTEAAVDVTAWDCTEETDYDFIPIGQPVANTQIHILDQQHQQTPIGIPGELCIGGVQVGRGYLNRPELTAEKFIQIALFGNTERVYKTGDLARWLPDGNLEYLGRIDNQIKLRGFRIELGEIEQVLSQYAAVNEAVVVLHERDENKALAAYVTLASENDQTDQVKVLDALTTIVANLREWLKTRLPDYMLPSYITILDSLPLTPNGKMDRKALPEPEITDETVPTRLQTETEQLLATLWTAVLKREVVSGQAHFFELGGHSLLATQLVARIREAFDIEMSLTTLFEKPILGELAHWLGQQQGGDILPPIQPQATDEPQILSYAQQRLWFLAQLEGQSSTYNMPAAMRLQGKLNLEALRVTFAELIKRQHSLRLSFPVIAGKAIAELLPVYDPMSIIDLSTLDTAAQQDQVKILGQTYRNTPFDLGTGPLFRLRLLVLSPDEHILLLNFHHIISDGWSMNVLIREWIALYTAYSQGQTPELQPLPIHYPDYAAWQRKWLQGKVLKKQQDYWTAQLAGAPQLIELPTDQPRPAQQSYQGAYYQHSLSAKLTTELNQLSQAHNSTLFMVLLSSFNVLLHRYTGQDDILIGTPIAGRTQRETENLIGLFVNTLVLRTQIGTACPFDELLRQTRQTTLQAYAHQDLPFEQLVEALQPERSLSHSPLFQVMFVLQNNEITELKLPNLAISSVEQTSTIAKFDLTLNITETAEQLELYWEYATDLFEPERIARMAAHFTTLLEHIVQNPRAEIQTLPLLTTAETTQLHAWNDTVTEYQEDLTLVDLFETQVKQTRDNIAVSFEGQTLSYQQLNTRANQLAHHLRSLTDTDNQALIQPDTLVGICVERSLEMIIGLLGILKAGAAYVPLDPDYPQDRLQYMLEDSQVRVLLTQRYLQTPLNTHSGIILCLDEADYFSTESTQNSLRRAGPDNLAYVIYTSGSTGKPKGAINAHRGIYNRIVWMQDHFGLTTEDRVLQKTPFSFDVSVWEFFWPLITGARLVIAKPQGHQDPHYLSQLIDEQRISTLHFVPPMLQAYLEAIPTADTSLQRIICSGEALPYTLQQRCLQTLPKVQLHNLYGPTEAAVDVTAWHCTEETDYDFIPIGQPVANTQIHILDQQHQQTPIGIPGELCIGGVQVGRGYLNQPELTAEKFIELKLFGETQRIYKTGDLTRWLPDGNLEYLGRMDNQIKLRGFRVELGEIEQVLSQHEAISEAVVALHEHDDNKTLAAYVTPQRNLAEVAGTENQEELPISVADLKAWLNTQLPEYMIPHAYTILDALPLTPNGKIDLQALPEPDRLALAAEFVAPNTAALQLIATIWQTLLHVDQVGVHDNFFTLGGHSLLAAQLVFQLQAYFYVTVPLPAVFANPTLIDLVDVLSTLHGTPDTVETIAEAWQDIKPS